MSKSGFSEESSNIIMASWRGSTQRTYKHYIKRWIQFCIQWERNFIEPSVNNLIDFLTMLFNEGKNYNSICVARSAVSALSLTSQMSIGSHQLVKRFLAGAFNLKPALPKNKVTWDPQIVLNFLKTWSPANNLSLLQLSIKVTLLCLLVSSQRGQTIHLIDIRNMSWERDRVICRFGDLMKTSTPKEHQSQIILKICQ